jgi:transcriptional regulator with XRE-family HTH domain
MSTRAGPIARALRTAADDEARLRSELDRARRGSGLSVADVGRASGLSRSATSRALSGRRPTELREYAAIGASVGLDVRLRAYPGGDPIRDAGQQRLLERLRVRIHPDLGWRTEVSLRIDGDLRAWDALIAGPEWTLPVEAETVIDDIQALERRLGRKVRDGGADHLLLVVAETRRNRQALAAAPAAFHDYTRDARAILRALAGGRAPSMSAIVIL